MSSDEWRLIFEGVVATVALAGFVLSLVGLWFTWWVGRPRIRVTMTVAVLAGADGIGPTMFVVTAFNMGRVPVALTGVGVDIHDRGQPKSSAFFLGPPPFAPPLPFVLQPGRAWNYHVDPEQVLEAHRSERALSWGLLSMTRVAITGPAGLSGRGWMAGRGTLRVRIGRGGGWVPIDTMLPWCRPFARAHTLLAWSPR